MNATLISRLMLKNERLVDQENLSSRAALIITFNPEPR